MYHASGQLEQAQLRARNLFLILDQTRNLFLTLDQARNLILPLDHTSGQLDQAQVHLCKRVDELLLAAKFLHNECGNEAYWTFGNEHYYGCSTVNCFQDVWNTFNISKDFCLKGKARIWR